MFRKVWLSVAALPQARMYVYMVRHECAAGPVEHSAQRHLARAERRLAPTAALFKLKVKLKFWLELEQKFGSSRSACFYWSPDVMTFAAADVALWR